MTSSLRSIRDDLGELLARHQKGQPLESFAKYENDPTGFIVDVLKGEPWLKQREIAELVRDHRKVVVRSCNAAGKDWLSGRLALWWVYARRGRVIITGATETQALEITMREAAKAFEAAGANVLSGEVRTKSLVIGGDKPVLVKTATEAGKLTGFHDERLLFIIGEGQSCDEHTYVAADACATGVTNRVFVVGNPTEPHGRFRKICESEVWQAVKISAFDIPNVIEGREAIPGLATVEWVRDVERDWGKNSSFYTSRVLAEFPQEHEFSLIKRDWLRACAYEARRDSMEDLLASVGTAAWGPETTRAARGGRGFDYETVHAFGFDVAATRDRCALAYFCDRDLIWCQAWRPEGDLFAETDRMLRLVERAVPLTKFNVLQSAYGRIASPAGFPLGRAVISIDAGGLGLGAYEHLRRRTKIKVEGFVASHAGDEATLNARAEGYVRLANAIAAGAVRIPRDEELWEELLEIRVIEGDRLRLEPKAEIRKRLGRSCDLADAVMMGWTAAEPWIRRQERIA